MRTFTLVSLGCAKNAVDLQIRAGRMLKAGWAFAADPEQADVIIVNTCAFIAAARAEAEAEIRRAEALKRAGRIRRVVVTGCYPQRYPEARRNFPWVDEWLGVPNKWETPKMPALRFTGKAFAYLKIAEGCAHRCAYCAIPAIRGPYRSRPLAAVLAEAQALLASGCRELNVVAQDPMLWGVDRKDGRRLEDLLWQLDRFPGDYWVRVLYSYPHEITPGFLEWMNTARHAVKYVDVPLQHTDANVLRRMNRAAAIPATLAAAERLRAAVPGVTLRTTVMTGFPGETPTRYARLLDDLKRMDFDHLGAFAFSPERGTAAFAMSGRPSRAVAEAREREVMRQQAQRWRKKARAMLGGELTALVVAPGVARLASQAPEVDGVTRVDSDRVGEFVRVRLERVRGFDFEGKVF